jgi:hypothetical protein
VHAAKPCGGTRSTLRAPGKLKPGGPSPADEEAFDREAVARPNLVHPTWFIRPGFDRTRKVKEMPLIQLLEVLIVVGVLLWLVNRFIPMQSSIKSILNGVVVIAVVLWLLNVFGLFHSLSRIRVGT